jgi:thiamine-phosphate pyrophosphorylase
MSEEPPRLSLIAPPLTDPELASKLQAALTAGDVASLRISAPAAASEELAILAQAAALAQNHGVAVIIEDSIDAMIAVGADGVEIAGAGPALRDAVKRLSPKHIVGSGQLTTRHEAMEAGEVGATYAAFGDAGGNDDEDLIGLVRWWAELFTTPCVAVAHRIADIDGLVEAGADFILLGGCVWDDPRGPAAAVAEAVEKLSAK